MRKLKTQKGITLVALIITIVVLLILAVVAIGTLQESNIIGHAQNSAASFNQSKANEVDALTKYEEEIEKYVPGEKTEEIVWGENSSLAPGLLFYIGKSKNLTVSTEKNMVETCIPNNTNTELKRTGEIKEFKFEDYTRISFMFAPDIETINFNNKLPANIILDLYSKENLKEVKGLEGLEVFGKYDGGKGFFENCINLEKVEIPNTLKEIKSYTFSNCSKLQNITIPNQINKIGVCAFRGCSSLTEINLPSQLSGLLEQEIVGGCTGLTKIEIPKGITAIHSQAFNGCVNLTEIKVNRMQEDAESVFGTDWIPDSVTKIIYTDKEVILE